MSDHKVLKTPISLNKNTYTNIDDVLFSSFRRYYEIKEEEGSGISLRKPDFDFSKTPLKDTYTIQSVSTNSSQKKESTLLPISTILITPKTQSVSFWDHHQILQKHKHLLIILAILLLLAFMAIVTRDNQPHKKPDKTNLSRGYHLKGAYNLRDQTFPISPGNNLDGTSRKNKEAINLDTTEHIDKSTNVEEETLKKSLFKLQELKKSILSEVKAADRLYDQKNYNRAYLQYKLIKTSLEKSIDEYKHYQENDFALIINELEKTLVEVNSNIFALETDITNNILETAEDESAHIKQEISSLQKCKSDTPLFQQREASLQIRKKLFYETIEKNLKTLNTFTTLAPDERISISETLNKTILDIKEFQSQIEKANTLCEDVQKAIDDDKLLKAQILITQIPLVNDTYTEKAQMLKGTIANRAGTKSRFYMKGHHMPGFQFRWCPPGNFKMGESSSNDNPRRSININNGFWILETEVTQEMWQSVMGTKPFVFSADKFQNIYEYMPAENVSFADCLEFCRRLTDRFGFSEYAVSLPTESEWEYACCAGKNFDSITPKFLPTAKTQTSRVRSGKPNDWGIYDMLGNVGEFCLRDSMEPEENEATHLVKGGDWQLAKESSANLTPYYRSTVVANEANSRTGFRIIIKTAPKE